MKESFNFEAFKILGKGVFSNPAGDEMAIARFYYPSGSIPKGAYSPLPDFSQYIDFTEKELENYISGPRNKANNPVAQEALK